MLAANKVAFTPEEIARMEIRNFVNEGLKDVQEGNLLDFDEMFDEIEKRYQDDETVDLTSLYNKRLIKGSKKNGILKISIPVKILGNGDFTKKLKFKISAISESARERILKAGGDAQVEVSTAGAKAGKTAAAAKTKKSTE